MTPAALPSSTVSLPDGRRLAYEAYGAPGGFPVLYHHGGLSSHSDISFAEGDARGRGVRIVAVDRPGIGESDRRRDRRVVDWAADVEALTAALGIDEFAALGWSAGGPFALACAAGLGPRVLRTVTVGGMAPLDDGHTASQLGLGVDRLLFPLTRRAPWAAGAVLRLSGVVPARAAQRRLVKSLPSASDRRIVAALDPAEWGRDLRLAMRHGPHGLVDDYVVLGQDWGFRPEDISGPVTVVQGDQDELVPMAHARRLAGRLPAGRLEVVAGAGHFLLHTHLAEVLDTLAGK